MGAPPMKRAGATGRDASDPTGENRNGKGGTQTAKGSGGSQEGDQHQVRVSPLSCSARFCSLPIDTYRYYCG